MKPVKQKLNIKLLRRVKRHILDEPRRLVMATFGTTGTPGKSFVGDNGQRQRFADCGTAACICGWINILTRGQEVANVGRASRKAGIASPSVVFLEGSWPAKFRDAFRKAKWPKTRAKIAAARIEHLIKTGE